MTYEIPKYQEYFQDLVTVGRIETVLSYVFIYLFSVQIRNSIFKNLQLPNIKYIRSKERCTSTFQKDIKTLQIYKCSIA